ncbi:hypothetical protein EVAR_5550_1 [Eumeta japonica]|uniref:Uncharacterized protein n=1 Tax=Eumeta variegata TaxID=151549 RepID=A0A4C1U1J4_EUMVA|nr:hypothetical protein EVAR_5550_1 [Eumeta japonica]
MCFRCLEIRFAIDYKVLYGMDADSQPTRNDLTIGPSECIAKINQSPQISGHVLRFTRRTRRLAPLDSNFEIVSLVRNGATLLFARITLAKRVPTVLIEYKYTTAATGARKRHNIREYTL